MATVLKVLIFAGKLVTAIGRAFVLPHAHSAPLSLEGPDGKTSARDVAGSIVAATAAGGLAYTALNTDMLSQGLAQILQAFGVGIDPGVVSMLVGLAVMVVQLFVRWKNGPSPAPKPPLSPW